MPNKNTIRFGRHQDLHLMPFRETETGIITGTIEFHNPESWDLPQFQYLSKKAGNAAIARMSISGVRCVTVERVYKESDALGIYTYTCEGVDPNSEEDAIFELDESMSKEPIETHPSFEGLAKKYFWDPIRREFARNIPTDASTSGLATANDATKRATNPLYGVTDYFVPGVIYRRSYAKADVPITVLLNVGTIVVPPGIDKFPNANAFMTQKGSYNWLKLAPKITRRGAAVEIVEEYLLSGPRGVNPDIYSQRAINPAGTNRGLITSSVSVGDNLLG